MIKSKYPNKISDPNFIPKKTQTFPKRYLVWLSQKGFPEGKLREMLQAVYEIKLNGLEYLFDKIKVNMPKK